MTLAYLVIDAFWILLCLRYRSQLITLHHFLSAIFLSQTIQSIFMVIEYETQNSQGTLLFSFVFFNIIFNVARNTFARLLILLLSMGVGLIPADKPRQHKAKIIILTVLYVVSNIAYLIAVYMNKINPLSPTIQLGVSIPLSFTNTLFFFWIVKALE